MYNREDLEKAALKAIEAYSLFFIEDVIVFLPCTKGTFYNHDLHELDTIKDALDKNKTIRKVEMRKKWHDSYVPSLQIALYKLLATDDELKRLSGQQIDHTTGGEKISAPPTLVFYNPDDERDPDQSQV